MCPVDFSKADDSVSHEYTASFFALMGLPQYLIKVLILLFRAPMALIVHDSVRLDQGIHRTSGIRQGCPVSPTLLALLISPIAVYLLDVNSCIEILLYADDLLIIITAPPMMAVTLLLQCLDVLERFSIFSGLSINSYKSGILLVGIWNDATKAFFSCIDIKVCSSYKYLGVKLGYVSPEEAFAPAMQKAMGRALSMQHWKLTLRERGFLLKLWILLVLVYPSRVIYPVKQVVESLKVIYNIALCLNTWGLTH